MNNQGKSPTKVQIRIRLMNNLEEWKKVFAFLSFETANLHATSHYLRLQKIIVQSPEHFMQPPSQCHNFIIISYTTFAKFPNQPGQLPRSHQFVYQGKNPLHQHLFPRFPVQIYLQQPQWRYSWGYQRTTTVTCSGGSQSCRESKNLARPPSTILGDTRYRGHRQEKSLNLHFNTFKQEITT